MAASSERTQNSAFDKQWWLESPVPKILFVQDDFVDDAPEGAAISCSSSVEDHWIPHPSHNQEPSSPVRKGKKHVSWGERRERRRELSVSPLPPPSTGSKPIKSVLKVKTAGPVLLENAAPLVPRVKATSLFVGEDVKATPLLVGTMPSIREDGNDGSDNNDGRNEVATDLSDRVQLFVSSLLQRDRATTESNRGTKTLRALLQGINGKASCCDTLDDHLGDRLGVAVRMIDDDINQAISPMGKQKQALKKKTLDFFAMLGELPQQIMLQLVLLKLSDSLYDDSFI